MSSGFRPFLTPIDIEGGPLVDFLLKLPFFLLLLVDALREKKMAGNMSRAQYHLEFPSRCPVMLLILLWDGKSTRTDFIFSKKCIDYYRRHLQNQSSLTVYICYPIPIFSLYIHTLRKGGRFEKGKKMRIMVFQ